MKYGDIKVGRKVITKRELMNGNSIIPIGSVGVVHCLYAGLEIHFNNRCEHCHFGERIQINCVSPNSVELVKE